MGDKHLLQK